MVWDELGRAADEANQRDRDRWIGVYIGVLAVILAICSMGGGNAAKDATLKNIEATNTWAFFQAKNLRRQALRLQVEQLEIMREGGEHALGVREHQALGGGGVEAHGWPALLTRDAARRRRACAATSPRRRRHCRRRA